MKTTYQSDKSFKDNLLGAITNAYRIEIDKFFENKKKEILSELDEQKVDFMYRTTLRLGEILRIQDFGREIVITFEKNK